MTEAPSRPEPGTTAGALTRARAIVTSGLTPRAVLVGAICVVLVSFVTSWAELVIQRISLGLIQFPPGAFGVFVLLIIGNRLVRRVRPGWALRAQELAICYAMMLMTR